MCPLRPTAIATPGATASSIAVLTILSSLAGSAVSSPELFRPICGPTYLIGAGAAAIRAGTGGAAQPTTVTIEKRAMEARDFISWEGARGQRGAGQLAGRAL